MWQQTPMLRPFYSFYDVSLCLFHSELLVAVKQHAADKARLIYSLDQVISLMTKKERVAENVI
jgi:hypothetical protein